MNVIQLQESMWVKEPGSCPTRVVLRLNPAKAEFVVHEEYVTEDGTVGYVHGFYTKDEDAARGNFDGRRKHIEQTGGKQYWSWNNILEWVAEWNIRIEEKKHEQVR